MPESDGAERPIRQKDSEAVSLDCLILYHFMVFFYDSLLFSIISIIILHHYQICLHT